MANYNRGPNDAFDRQKEVGENCTLFLPNTDTVGTAVTSVSFSEEANTSEVQYNTGFSQSIAVTGVTYSGSFEVAGNANIERDEGWSDPDSGTSIPQNVGTMTIEDGDGRQYDFTNVLLNSHSKDMPADDRTTQSFDFMAEGLTVTTSE